MWDAITHTRTNFKCGSIKPPLMLGHWWVITSRCFILTWSCIHVIIPMSVLVSKTKLAQWRSAPKRDILRVTDDIEKHAWEKSPTHCDKFTSIHTVMMDNHIWYKYTLKQLYIFISVVRSLAWETWKCGRSLGYVSFIIFTAVTHLCLSEWNFWALLS